MKTDTAQPVIPTTFWYVGVLDIYRVDIIAKAPNAADSYIVEFAPPRDDIRYDQLQLSRLCEKNDYYANELDAYRKLIAKTEKFLKELKEVVAEQS